MTATKIPPIALALGFSGLIPFIAGAAYLGFGPLTMAQLVFNALVGYGAVILSFMGAIYWGLAMVLPPDRHDARSYWLSVSVVPALVGWGAALIALLGSHLLALLVLIGGFIGIYLLDRIASRESLVPGWYLRLRLPLTLIVVVCLLIAAGTFV